MATEYKLVESTIDKTFASSNINDLIDYNNSKNMRLICNGAIDLINTSGINEELKNLAISRLQGHVLISEDEMENKLNTINSLLKSGGYNEITFTFIDINGNTRTVVPGVKEEIILEEELTEEEIIEELTEEEIIEE